MSTTTARLLADYQSPLFTIDSISLTVELDDHHTRVTSQLRIIRQGEHDHPLALDGEQLTLMSVMMNQQSLSTEHYQQTDEQLIIATTLNEFDLVIETQINPLENTALEGLFKSGEAFCTQCEAEGFRRISYYLDRPDVMAKFTCKVIADKQAYPHLLANGNLLEQGDLADGKHFATWRDPFPKPCYLFALVAGNFDVLRDQYLTAEGRLVALEIYVDQGNLEKAHHAMASLKKAMHWDEQTFGLAYDLDIYMIVAVDFFNMGAMENKGLNIFNSKYVLADTKSATDADYFNIESVIAHEYFHNWTGNRVTCRDWFQLSLKEGLTVFRDQQFSADMHSPAVCRIQNVRSLRSLQFAEDASPMAHPIRPEKVLEMSNFYTMTVYEKGAEVIRMIHTLLGAQKFRLGMDLYFARHDGQAVTCDDFVNAMADASNIDLSIFKRWYSQSGTPLLQVQQTWLSDEQTLLLTIKQINHPTTQQPNKQTLHIPIAIELLFSKGQAKQQLLELTSEQQTWRFEHLAERPVVSLLANFSAPVKLDSAVDDAALKTIILTAIDDFSRWDAVQQLFGRYVKQLVVNPASDLPSELLSIVEYILTSTADPALIAEQLTLPSFDEMLETLEQVDAIALVDAIDRLASFIAAGLNEQFTTIYQQCQQQQYCQDALSVAKRQLKNVCLWYLAKLPEQTECIKQQFDNADNMTDTLAAMRSASVNNLQEFTRQMGVFEHKWYENSLVMDKWFTLAAMIEQADIFERLASLLEHPLFSLKNPNRARSLLGAFAQHNPRYFHCLSGRGYQFLAQQIARLNGINPQVASRLLTPLIQFKHLDAVRQELIKQELQQLQKLPNLSRDLLEKLNAALA